MKQSIVSGLLFAGMVSVSGAASAATTINFDGMTEAAYGGHSNVAASGSCSPADECYEESGMVMGVVADANPINHLHQELNDFAPDGVTPLYEVAYHNDSSGIYMRNLDGGAFKLLTMDFSAPWGVAAGNARAGSWEILGFNQADNPDLSSGDGTNYTTRVAYQTVSNTSANNFNGNLTLNSDFNDADGINAFWIHFIGEPDSPPSAGLPYKMHLDNVLVEPAAVPVPAAVWMFGTGLLGLLSFGRKKAGQLAA